MIRPSSGTHTCLHASSSHAAGSSGHGGSAGGGSRPDGSGGGDPFDGMGKGGGDDEYFGKEGPHDMQLWTFLYAGLLTGGPGYVIHTMYSMHQGCTFRQNPYVTIGILR